MDLENSSNKNNKQSKNTDKIKPKSTQTKNPFSHLFSPNTKKENLQTNIGTIYEEEEKKKINENGIEIPKSIDKELLGVLEDLYYHQRDLEFLQLNTPYREFSELEIRCLIEVINTNKTIMAIEFPHLNVSLECMDLLLKAIQQNTQLKELIFHSIRNFPINFFLDLISKNNNLESLTIKDMILTTESIIQFFQVLTKNKTIQKAKLLGPAFLTISKIRKTKTLFQDLFNQNSTLIKFDFNISHLNTYQVEDYLIGLSSKIHSIEEISFPHNFFLELGDKKLEYISDILNQNLPGLKKFHLYNIYRVNTKLKGKTILNFYKCLSTNTHLEYILLKGIVPNNEQARKYFQKFLQYNFNLKTIHVNDFTPKIQQAVNLGLINRQKQENYTWGNENNENMENMENMENNENKENNENNESNYMDKQKPKGINYSIYEHKIADKESTKMLKELIETPNILKSFSYSAPEYTQEENLPILLTFLNKNTGMEKLKLSNLIIGEELVVMLSNVIKKHTTIKILNLEKCHFCSTSFSPVFSAISENKNLSEVNLKGIDFRASIYKNFKCFLHLDALKISGDFGGDKGVDSFIKTFTNQNSHLRKLQYHGNNVTEHGEIKLSKWASNYNSLTHFHLFLEYLDESLINYIIEIIKPNKNLKHISFLPKSFFRLSTQSRNQEKMLVIENYKQLIQLYKNTPFIRLRGLQPMIYNANLSIKKHIKLSWHHLRNVNSNEINKFTEKNKRIICKQLLDFWKNESFTDCEISGIKCHKFWIEIRTGQKFQFIQNTLKKVADREQTYAFLSWVYFGYVQKHRKSFLRICNQLKINEPFQFTIERQFKQLFLDGNSKKFKIIVTINNQSNDKKKDLQTTNEQDEDIDGNNDENKNEQIKHSNKIIKVHKFILLLRSGLFRKLFKSVTDIGNQITDYTKKSYTSLQIFYKYLYYNEIFIDFQLLNNKVTTIIEDLYELFNYHLIDHNTGYIQKLEDIETQYKKWQYLNSTQKEF
ncbi:nacht [Anaeramoeba flamelloides]|uniref:Nacht n=1 Tax=Anaeramoeba flamelloides TaxID=1746091 RepID=A0ABQ8Y8Z5_9EUKA|nr:nacht [Anaeramoeba flamelloides]